MCIQEILSQSAWPSLTYKPNTSQENAQNGAGGQGAVERGGGAGGRGQSTPPQRQQKPDPAAGKGYCSISRHFSVGRDGEEGVWMGIFVNSFGTVLHSGSVLHLGR